MLEQSPWQAGISRSRWWLDGVRQAVSWLADCCLATVWQTLARWKLVYRRGRRAVHSPDWEYPAKVQRLETISWYSRTHPEQIVRLYEDELTYYRRPTLVQGYAPAGSALPRAEQGYGSNTARRIAACLDTHSGRLFAWQRAHFDRQTLGRFYQEVEQSYPQAEQVFLIHDNWSVHRHPDLVAGLRGSKMTLVLLPTYAPWLNPVEKVWRQLYAEVLHLHPWVDAWEQEQAAVQGWLDRWANGSPDLLRSVGLSPG